IPVLWGFNPFCANEQQKRQDAMNTANQVIDYYHNVLEIRNRLQHSHFFTVPGRYDMAVDEVPQEALTAYRNAGRETLAKLDAVLEAVRLLVGIADNVKMDLRWTEPIPDGNGRPL
ncbi:MAG: hypothetical protein Q9212_006651, partial [Teloschistes hypoglaucus]